MKQNTCTKVKTILRQSPPKTWEVTVTLSSVYAVNPRQPKRATANKKHCISYVSAVLPLTCFTGRQEKPVGSSCDGASSGGGNPSYSCAIVCVRVFSFCNNCLPHGSVRAGANWRKVLVALRDFPHGFINLLSVESGSLFLRHSCGFTGSSATTKQTSGNFCPFFSSSTSSLLCMARRGMCFKLQLPLCAKSPQLCNKKNPHLPCTFRHNFLSRLRRLSVNSQPLDSSPLVSAVLFSCSLHPGVRNVFVHDARRAPND